MAARIHSESEADEEDEYSSDEEGPSSELEVVTRDGCK